MKTNIYIISILTLLLISFNSCEDKITEEYLQLDPVYMSFSEIRSNDAIRFENNLQLKNTGKIYLKGQYIFINEVFKGVHVYDNANPENPSYIGFIRIPGNMDIAIKDNYLFADSFVDVVVLDISTINSPQLVKRIENVYDYRIPPYDEKYRLGKIDPVNGMIIDWEITKVRKEVDTPDYTYYPIYWGAKYLDANFTTSGGPSTNVNTETGSSYGVSGSMARFGLLDNTLYSIDEHRLFVFDISDATQTEMKTSDYLTWGMETLFITNEHLFLGTMNGMHIYSVEDRFKPEFISNFAHVTSCDPVVVQGDYAYVTLRGGTTCGGDLNQLDVVNVSNYAQPFLAKSYDMVGPYGLGIDDELLFVCDGDAGLKVYDVTLPLAIDQHQLAHFPGINAYDVIPLGESLLMIGKDGLYQYDYSNIQDIKQISVISTK
ncbi:hypothetical protein EYV94_22205 [Puteibacter caeruleilacunae]|nr:hypothetical protein EYV94_22205 [Puteibacter caeruleilacunae]